MDDVDGRVGIMLAANGEEASAGVLASVQMSNDHERGERGRLADAIHRRRQDIERRWLERVRAVLGEHEISSSELRDSMPEYLDRLADALHRPDEVEAAGGASWEDVTRQHAEERVRLGFDIDQLVHEFIILRQTLLEVVSGEEEGRLLDVPQATRIADLVEGAIAASVSSYVRFRDGEMRRKEAQHVGFITHELRNPLTTIALGVAKLRRTLELGPEDERAFALIERNQQRLVELIDRILRFEREAGREPCRVRTTLGQVLEEPLVSARLVADAKGLELHTSFDPDIVLEIDPRLTSSAVDNVVQNALKYTDEGDVRIQVEDHPGEVVIHVRDSCPGISREDLPAIFEPFRRGRSDKPGAGLGLAIARSAIDAQGGSIHVEPGAARGCHFALTLPKPRS